MSRPAPRPGEAGFSLVEALIALAIIAAMTAVLVETITADAHVRLMVRERREALMIAQSALDRALGGETGDSGHFQDLDWRVEREPYGEAAAFASGRLEQVTVVVEDADHHQLVSLASIRIAP